MTPSILQRVAGGDTRAPRECIDRYGALVWSLARRLSRTSSDAEDATQEIFLRIWRQAAHFEQSLCSEPTFIAMIARRHLIERHQKITAEPPMDSSVGELESIAGSRSDPITTEETHTDVEQVMQALAELRLEHRQVLELVILQGLALSQTATCLDIPLGTVKSHLRGGVMRVRECMGIGNCHTSDDRERKWSRPD